MTSTLTIADDFIEIDGITHSYGVLDTGAHAVVHAKNATATEKGLAVAILAFLDRLDRVGRAIIEAQDLEFTDEQIRELQECFCAHCEEGDGICPARVLKMMGDALQQQAERILA